MFVFEADGDSIPFFEFFSTQRVSAKVFLALLPIVKSPFDALFSSLLF